MRYLPIIDGTCRCSLGVVAAMMEVSGVYLFQNTAPTFLVAATSNDYSPQLQSGAELLLLYNQPDQKRVGLQARLRAAHAVFLAAPHAA
jgi:hypothetical protein